MGKRGRPKPRIPVYPFWTVGIGLERTITNTGYGLGLPELPLPIQIVGFCQPISYAEAILLEATKSGAGPGAWGDVI